MSSIEPHECVYAGRDQLPLVHGRAYPCRMRWILRHGSLLPEMVVEASVDEGHVRDSTFVPAVCGHATIELIYKTPADLCHEWKRVGE